MRPSQRPLCPLSAARGSCFSPGPATLAQPLSYRGEQARPPITSRRHSGALCAGRSGYPGHAGGGSAPGGGQRPAETSTRGVFGKPRRKLSSLRVPGALPEEPAAWLLPPSAREGPRAGQGAPLGWVRASRWLRRRSSGPGARSRDKAPASGLPSQPGLPVSSSSAASSREPALEPKSVVPLTCDPERGARGGSVHLPARPGADAEDAQLDRPSCGRPESLLGSRPVLWASGGGGSDIRLQGRQVRAAGLAVTPSVPGPAPPLAPLAPRPHPPVPVAFW